MEINIVPNDVINHYRFEHPIGSGAYGMVWKAHHQHLDRPCAIKVIDTRDLELQNLERVKQECRIGGKLDHQDHVVRVYDAFPEGDQFYIVMELMTGGSLERYLRDHPHPDLGLTLAWALDLCTAMEQVHALGVVHRDIKPQNILLTDEAQVKLSDFGVSHLPDSGLTTVFQPGTPGYRAPEQEANQPVDAGADVYALCAVLFEVWSGRKYVQYKHAEREVVREELSLLLQENYPGIETELRDRLIDAVLAGLRPRPTRIALADLRGALDAIQADWRAAKKGEKAFQAAQAQVAQQLQSTARPTVVSHLPQRPVAARSAAAGQSALTSWLEDQFGRWYGETRGGCLVLWFDPGREWEPLLRCLSPGLDLIRYQGSLLEVRYEIEQRSPGGLTVAYLPLKQVEADYLLPYCFTSRVFERTVYAFLLEHDTPLPRGGPARHEVEALLPQLAEASVGKGPGFWQGITSPEAARQALFPDFGAQLGQFLDRPEETWQSLEQAQRAEPFRALIAARFGFAAPAGDPAGYAQAFVAHLCLVELYVQAGMPDTFSYPLPPGRHFQDCQSALDTWRYDSRYQDRSLEYARAIEADYPGLVEWAGAYVDRLADPPLPGVARAQWEQTATEIAGWSSFGEASAYLRQHEVRIRQAAQGTWAALGETPGWAALALAGDLARAVDRAIEDTQQWTTTAAVLRAYLEEGWPIDGLYRQCKGALEAAFAGSAALEGWVDRFYARFLSEINGRWTTLLSRQETWGFPGVLPDQDRFWHKVTASVASRKAIFFVDALRYELGQSLCARLQTEYEVEVEPLMTGLPSTTPLGMSALLPQADQREIGWQGGDWRITVSGFEGNLASKADRDKWLGAQLPEVEIVALNSLLLPQTEIDASRAWLIVHAGQIDAVGENAAALTPGVLEDLLNQLARAVHKIARAGFDEIHIVGDHGFLLLDRVADHGKAELDAGSWLKKSPRYAVGREPVSNEHLRFPIPGSPDLLGWFPHGVACFKAWGQYNFVHGGPALQEVIVPHLTVRTSPLSQPVGIEIEADEETRVAFFKVTLRPVAQGLISQEREVRLALERQDGSAIRDSVEIVGVSEPVVKNLKVYPGDNVAQGDLVYVTAYDAQTGERLARHPIRFQVSLEL